MLGLWSYARSPGSRGIVPTQWPRESNLHLAEEHPTIVLFVHPHCPCTRSCLEELSRILAYCRNKVTVYTLFWKPARLTRQWAETDLWRQADALARSTSGQVSLILDEDGAEARRHGVSTSGHVVVYGNNGRLLFTGGITAARGHAGDNSGKTAVLSLLLSPSLRDAPVREAPVFGCPLFDLDLSDS